MTEALVTLLSCVALVTCAVVYITIANWPRGATPRRPLGDTMELAPFERL